MYWPNQSARYLVFIGLLRFYVVEQNMTYGVRYKYNTIQLEVPHIHRICFSCPRALCGDFAQSLTYIYILKLRLTMRACQKRLKKAIHFNAKNMQNNGSRGSCSLLAHRNRNCGLMRCVVCVWIREQTKIDSSGWLWMIAGVFSWAKKKRLFLCDDDQTLKTVIQIAYIYLWYPNNYCPKSTVTNTKRNMDHGRLHDCPTYHQRVCAHVSVAGCIIWYTAMSQWAESRGFQTS